MKTIDKIILGCITLVLVYTYYVNLNANNIMNDLPATGQDMTIIFIMLALAVCGILLLIFLKKRKRDDE